MKISGEVEGRKRCIGGSSVGNSQVEQRLGRDLGKGEVRRREKNEQRSSGGVGALYTSRLVWRMGI